jgi:5-methylcytosine-specific restriction enzyme A
MRERDHKIIKEKKKQVLKIFGELKCEACDFDFNKTYGLTFIDCHHNEPLEYVGECRTSLKDLSILCANCHRAIHRLHPWLTVEELRRLLKTNK